MFAISLLSILVMGAWGTGVAQAVKSEWMIENKRCPTYLSKNRLPRPPVARFAILVPALNTSIECAKVEGEGTILKGGSDELKLMLGSCKVAEMPFCKITEPVKLEAKTELIEAGEVIYDSWRP